MNRLPAPMGLLIDRDQPLDFSFDGHRYQGLQGDSIASALLANGRFLISRSFKYHRPRGPLTMAGQDANSLVQLPQEPNVLADAHALSAGLQVTAQNVNGSLDNDKDAYLGKFSKFMPVGFYYRSFYKPKGMWKIWEPIIRKKAGLGVLDLKFQPEYYDKAYLFTDVAVIGAGPAGLHAALTAANAGAKVLLIEQQTVLGGSLTYARFDIEGNRAETLRRELLAAVEQHANIHILTEATCNAWFTDNYLPVIQGKRLYKVRARQCLVCSGAFDQPVVFRNNDLPGVMLTSAAQRLMKLYAVKPGNRAVVLTGNDDGYLAALDLHDQGWKWSPWWTCARGLRTNPCWAPWRNARFTVRATAPSMKPCTRKACAISTASTCARSPRKARSPRAGSAWIAIYCACLPVTCRSINCCARPAVNWPTTTSVRSSPSAACHNT